jgi:hypothetical protein
VKYLYVFISNLETDGLSDLQYTSEVGGQVAVTSVYKDCKPMITRENGYNI